MRYPWGLLCRHLIVSGAQKKGRGHKYKYGSPATKGQYFLHSDCPASTWRVKGNDCWDTAECRHLERERSYHWRKPKRNSHSYGRRSGGEGKEEELWKITEKRLQNLKLLNKSSSDKRKCLYGKREREGGRQRKKKGEKGGRVGGREGEIRGGGRRRKRRRRRKKGEETQ